MPFLLPFLAFVGCFGEFGVNEDDDDEDPASDSADPWDDTETGDVALATLEIEPGTASLTTRETAGFTLTAHYDDGSEADVTALAAWSSSDEDVVRVFVAGVAQPLGIGAATVTASLDGASAGATVEVTAIATVAPGDLVFNEVLHDVPPDADLNGDGVADTVEDEFVEIVNAGTATVDLSGAALYDAANAGARHTFAAGTVVRAGEAVVVFGGGAVQGLGGAGVQYVVAENADDPLELGLALNNGGDTLRLVAADGITTLAEVTYTGEVQDASWVLDPEIDGTSWTHHAYVSGSSGPYSPGALATGAPLPGPEGRYGR